MLALKLPAKGPNRGGALHICLLCNQPGCERHETCCPRCRTNCWLCGNVKAVENCARCVRKASRDLLTARNSRALRLRAITGGSAGLTLGEAKELLKPSGLNTKLIREAAGGGAAGTKALKDAALVFASKMQQVFQNGGSVTELYVPTKQKSETYLAMHRGRNYTPMTAPAAIDAVDALLKKRGIEPMYGDVPADCLAMVAEMIAEAGDGVGDALVLADLTTVHEHVNGMIVDKVRNARTHYHGWTASNIEGLESFARSEAEKAIKRVLGRSRAAVEARRAKEPPKKKRARARQAKSEAKVKKAKADGTYKNPRTGDTKQHFKGRATVRDRMHRVKLAYNKVERLGPGACTRLEIDRHAEYIARREQKNRKKR